MVNVLFILDGEKVGQGTMPLVPGRDHQIRIPRYTLRVREVTWVVSGTGGPEDSLVELDVEVVHPQQHDLRD